MRLTWIGLVLVALLGCGDVPPHAVLPLSPSGNLTLHVSNQSFALETVDIDVLVDGKLAVTGDFDVGSQHSWYTFRIDVPGGAHTVRAVSARGEVMNELAIEIVDGDAYVVVSFWYDPRLRVDPNREMSITFHEDPVTFD